MTLPRDTPFLCDPGALQVCRMLEEAGYQALFVGGCVRNAVMGHPQSDVDMATDARPERVSALAAALDLRVIPTGIEHGTVTVLAHGTPFEITTFRRDVATDGRRAVVAFSDRIEDDALRRDFTMNALYARSDGTIIDPVQGLDDARAARVVFIQDATARIREDYLRVLRFFRFWSFYADQGQGFDPQVLAAIAANLDGLETLSAERVGQEMRKILAAPDPAPAIATMHQIGVLARILPIADDRALPRLVHLEEMTHTAPDSMRRLSVLGPMDATDRLRLSKVETRDLSALTDAMGQTYGARALGHLLGQTRGWDAMLVRAASLEQPLDPEAQTDVTTGAAQTFPVTAADLMDRFQGPALGKELARLREIWLRSDLSQDRHDLLG
jgi:poly(A) polymerase